MENKVKPLRFGDAKQRFEDDRFLTGNGQYVTDSEIENVAYAKIVRSNHASGRIIGIDLAAAKKLTGVIDILTYEAAKKDNIGNIKSFMKRLKADGSPNFEPNYSLLAESSIHHIGEAIAMVIAEDESIAQQASEMINVEVEVTPAVTQIRQAIAHDAPQVWDEEPTNICFVESLGDSLSTNKAFETADYIIEDEFTISRVIASPMETRSAIGFFDKKTGKYQLRTGTQVPHLIRNELAVNVLGVRADDLRIISPDIGGGFGLKASVQRELGLVLWASKRLNRPVRWVADRSDSFLGDHHARDNIAQVSLALDSTGHFLGLRVNMYCAIGAFIDSFALHIMVNNVGGLSGPYNIGNYDVNINGVFTNTQPIAPYRGAGRPEATYCIERIIDIASRTVGISPIELRHRNMVGSDAMPFNTGLTFVYDSGDFKKVMDSALSLANTKTFHLRKEEAKKRGRLLGQGISYAVEIANGPQETPGHEVAKINFTSNGNAKITVGSHNHGQGHETAFRQLAGEFLGLDPERTTIEFGDTDLIHDAIGTFGSRSAATCGAAIQTASLEIIKKGKIIASDEFETTIDDINFSDGNFLVSGTDLSINIHNLAKKMENQEIEKKQLNLNAFAKSSPIDCTFPNACHVCEVEIDPETGFVEIKAYYLADDVGHVLNPLILEGQFHGGIAQGIGQALYEEIIFDGSTGQLLTGSFMDYCFPRADDFPPIQMTNCNIPSPNTIFGLKGAGEAGTVGSIVAVMNAISDALKEAGASLPAMPVTSERIWKTLRDTGNGGLSGEQK